MPDKGLFIGWFFSLGTLFPPKNNNVKTETRLSVSPMKETLSTGVWEKKNQSDNI